MQPWPVPVGAEYQRLRPDPVPRGRLVLQLAIAAIVGGAAGAALAVFVWALMLMLDRASSCDRGDSPVPIFSGACLNGVGPILGKALPVALVAGVLAMVLLFRRGRARRVVVVIAFVAGGFAGQPLVAASIGTVLPVAWTAPRDPGTIPGDPGSSMSTAGVWTAGGSLIQVQTDRVLSYDAATGHVQWTLPVPGGYLPCAVSDTSASAIGLLGYGRMDNWSIVCDHVLAIDLRAGRQLWSMRAPANQGAFGEGSGALAVVGQTAVLTTSHGVMALDARSGARRWTRPDAPGCGYYQVAGSARALVTLANCSSSTSVSVSAIDPATGRQAWQALLPGGSDPSGIYQEGAVTVLSASPVVIGSPGQGTGGSLLVRVLGPGGVVTATFPADLRSRTMNDGYGDFLSPVTVAGGLLVGVAGPGAARMHTGLPGVAVAAYRLSDGRQQWRDAVPAGVADIAFSGGVAVIIDESGPDYMVREVNVGTGQMRPLGHIPPGDLEVSITWAAPDDWVAASVLYAVPGRYVIVNVDGDPSVAAFAVP